jgi:hypothetical protein
MIWATAKSTEVKSFQSPCPKRARTLGPDGRVEAAVTTAGVAIAGSYRAENGAASNAAAKARAGSERSWSNTPGCYTGAAPRLADSIGAAVTRSLPARFDAYIAPSALIMS